MVENVLEQVFGRGWAFPPIFTLAEGVGMVSGAEEVRQSLIILFSTLPGERIMRQDYGCDLNQFMFANISTGLTTEIEAQILDSILSCERRAEVTAINIQQGVVALNRLQIQVVYRLRGSDLSQKITTQLDIGNGQGMFL